MERRTMEGNARSFRDLPSWLVRTQRLAGNVGEPM